MAVHGGYTEHFVGRVSSLARRVSRATHRLLRHRLRYGVSASSSSSRRRTRPVVDTAGSGSGSGSVAGSRRQPAGGVVAADGKGDGAGAEADKEEEEEDDGIWRRAILMGGRCQPLDFAGAIHYDSFGRRLARPPSAAPRCASSLSCRSSESLATYLETTEV